MRIALEQLKPGMIVGAPVTDCNGRLLIGSGVQLTDKQLRVLKIWRISEVDIEEDRADGTGAEAEPGIDPAVLKAAEEMTQDRFRHVDLDHPAIKELFRIRARRIGMMLQAEKRSPCTPSSSGKAAGKCTPPRSSREVGSSRGTAGSERGAVQRSEGATEELEQIKKGKGARAVDLDRLLQKEIKLPALPSIFTEIQEVIQDPRCSFRSIASVIAKDTGLTAQLLKLVNSSLYSFPEHIDSLQRAVTILGTRQLSTLALGVMSMSVFKGISQNLVDMKAFWEHNIACASLARLIASYKNLANTERLFIGGLLHDVGRMILYGHLAAQAREALIEAAKTKEILNVVEERILGFTHGEVGAHLIRKWKLPVLLEGIVESHHTPALSQEPLESSIVHVADVMTNALGIGSSGEHFVPPLSAEAWDILGIEIGAIHQIAGQLECQLKEVGKSLVDHD